MPDELLQVTARCKDNEACVYTGEDMFLDIAVANISDQDIGFPIEYAQARGPVVRLVDSATKNDGFVKPNLADEALMAKMKTLAPGESEKIVWVIKSEELEQFGGDYVDVTAEITVMVPIRVGDETQPFKGSSSLHIVSQNKPAESDR